MGHQPVMPTPRSADEALAMFEQRWKRQLGGRRSVFGWRRRLAYEACRSLIRAREAAIGLTPDPWLLLAPPKPKRPAEPTFRSA